MCTPQPYFSLRDVGKPLLKVYGTAPVFVYKCALDGLDKRKCGLHVDADISAVFQTQLRLLHKKEIYFVVDDPFLAKLFTYE